MRAIRRGRATAEEIAYLCEAAVPLSRARCRRPTSCGPTPACARSATMARARPRSPRATTCWRWTTGAGCRPGAVDHRRQDHDLSPAGRGGAGAPGAASASTPGPGRRLDGREPLPGGEFDPASCPAWSGRRLALSIPGRGACRSPGPRLRPRGTGCSGGARRPPARPAVRSHADRGRSASSLATRVGADGRGRGLAPVQARAATSRERDRRPRRMDARGSAREPATSAPSPGLLHGERVQASGTDANPRSEQAAPRP